MPEISFSWSAPCPDTTFNAENHSEWNSVNHSESARDHYKLLNPAQDSLYIGMDKITGALKIGLSQELVHEYNKVYKWDYQTQDSKVAWTSSISSILQSTTPIELVTLAPSSYAIVGGFRPTLCCLNWINKSLRPEKNGLSFGEDPKMT